MGVADRAAATGQAQVLFELLDQVIPVQQQPHPRMPGEEGHNRILQACIAIGEEMEAAAEQGVVEQKRQHESQHLEHAGPTQGKSTGGVSLGYCR